MGVEIIGLKQLEEALANAPKNLRRSAMRKALQAGGEVFRAEVESRAPERTDAYEDSDALPPGALKADIVVAVSTREQGNIGKAYIGPSKDTSHVARWVEFGHRMLGHKERVDQWFSKRKFIKPDLGVQVPPHPFMRPAFDSAADAAVEAFADSLTASLPELAKGSE